MSFAPLLAVLLVPVGHADPYQAATPAVRTETRQVGAFDALSSEGSVDVVVQMGGSGVSVTCDADLVSRVETFVRGGTLHVRIADHQPFHSHGPCRVDIGTEHLGAVAIAGSGDVDVHGAAAGLASLAVGGSGNLTVDAAQVDALNVDLAGSGDIRIAGTATSLQVTIAGSGDVDLSGVRAARAQVAIMGSGDATVAPSELVDATIAGSGDVLVRGHPEVHSSVVGSGRVRSL